MAPRAQRQTRFDLRVPAQFDALMALLGKEAEREASALGPTPRTGRIDLSQTFARIEEELRPLAETRPGGVVSALQLRRSRSANEQEGSLRSQVLGALDTFARLGENRSLSIVYVFADTTGGKLWRRGLLDPVVHDAQAGVFKELWHLDSSRLGRMPPKQVMAYLEALEAASVRARDLSRPHQEEGFATDVMRMIEAQQNHDELLVKARRSIERTLHRFMERPLHAGPAPYGMAYEVWRTDLPDAPVRVIPRTVHFRRAKYESARLVPGDPKEVETFRWMVSMAVDEHLGRRGIVQALNAHGVPSPSGTIWNPATVAKTLRNRAYVGDATHFAECSGEYMSLGSDGRPVDASAAPKRRPRDQVPLKPDVHVGLISRERWEALQRELDGRPVAKANQHTLRGDRIVPPANCGHCGKAMKWHRSEDGLRCSGYENYGLAVCRSHRCKASEVARLLWRAHARDVSALFGDGDLRGKVRARVREILAAEREKDEQPVDVAALRKRITEITREADRLVDGLSREALELLDGRLRRLAGERKELERQIASAAKQTKPRASELNEEIEAAVEHLEVLAQDPSTVSDDSLRALLASVVRPGSLLLRWRRRPGTEGRRRGAFELAEVEVDLLDPVAALAASTVAAEKDPPLRATTRRGRSAC